MHCSDGVRLCLCGTAASNGPFFHPPWDMSEYGAAMIWYWQGKTEGLGEKPGPVPLCPPQIPHWLTWALTNRGLRGEKPATNQPSYITECRLWYQGRSWNSWINTGHSVTDPVSTCLVFSLKACSHGFGAKTSYYYWSELLDDLLLLLLSVSKPVSIQLLVYTRRVTKHW
jgi:hypothetical protein